MDHRAGLWWRFELSQPWSQGSLGRDQDPFAGQGVESAVRLVASTG